MQLMQAERSVFTDLAQQKILRAAYSERQLNEVMVDFWFNHFNVFAGKAQVSVYLTEYERDTIRPHALGRFRDLLGATAHGPAMLIYLDNWRSAARGINENYARELMELHTLGVDGGYTQKDVQDVARAFTGWTLAAPRQGGGFRFDPRMHEVAVRRLRLETDLRRALEADLSALFAGPGRLRLAFGEIDPPEAGDPTAEQVDDAVRACWQNPYDAFGRPAGTSLICIQGEWSNVVDARIKGRFRTVVADSEADAYNPLYARAMHLPKPWGVTALLAEHTGKHPPIEIAWPLERHEAPVRIASLTFSAAPVAMMARPARIIVVGAWRCTRRVPTAEPSTMPPIICTS